MISLTSPVKTRAHDWPAGVKLSFLCLATFCLFFIQSLTTHLAILTLVLVLYAAPGRVFLVSGLSRLRVLWPFLVVITAWHLFEGTHVDGAVILSRLLSAVALANLVTMTTRLTDIIDVIRFLSAPLARFGYNSRAPEIAIALVIRMTPVLLEKGSAVLHSWKARSPRGASWRIILPFTLVALDDAENVADALKARGGINPMTPEN